MSVNEDITASISLIIDNPFSSMLDFSHFSGLDKNEADLKPSNQRGNHWAVDYLLGKRLSYTFHFVPFYVPMPFYTHGSECLSTHRKLVSTYPASKSPTRGSRKKSPVLLGGSLRSPQGMESLLAGSFRPCRKHCMK